MSTKERKPIRTCFVILLVVVIIVICALVVLGGVGYYLYSTGRLTINDVLGWIGMGPAEIQIANLSDSDLYAELTYFDEETGEESHYRSLELASFDISTIGDLSAGEYKLTFTTSTSLPVGGTCWLSLNNADEYRFVAVPEGIAVVLAGEDVDSVEEIDILSSSLCRP